MSRASPSKLGLLGGLAVLAVVYLTAGLVWLLPAPGFGTSRLLLFAVVVAVAWIGAVGALRHRPGLTAVGGVGLLLLGFWQAVLWIFMLPAAAVLLAAAGVLSSRREDAS